ncbi:16S rRNA (adenine(1518)-N(6)/adenine(1519)-N(6))-dimethyltransferase RsmA [Thioflexithrix psekupsensis]|uniref:Ribosomal RNA small subunit methyltransferase A n=1 Tax=Thioflexithrix psekupsensis TaxID=1570016 RepID=A0A251X493_9GAMM|nr:16S rRNA (adenine(1518)-N(6)/adenine(1519)-N(6))-dimethyltransferase RsmA [Thioflexithrix psekupsensis]OUD11999.1 16S rRNA (adenine(1518)-N(6)/adenine(1519)-N(6))-dimethyltransferase [Thioflexithrix psekupsensis]
MKTHFPRKRFGQHFLHDPTVIQRIIQLLNVDSHSTLIEIGPGRGALTLPLLQRGVCLHAIELDRDLIDYLSQLLNSFIPTQLTLHAADALQFDFSIFPVEKPLHIIGNLPYNISTPLLFHLLRFVPQIESMTFMLQKEVVDRMAASSGESDYGRLSVMTQYYCRVEKRFDVGAGAFHPPPKVESSIVQLYPYQEFPIHVQDMNALHKIVAASFSQRRKTLRNTLKTLLSSEHIEALGIDPQSRAETLSLSQFVQLANQLTLTGQA